MNFLHKSNNTAMKNSKNGENVQMTLTYDLHLTLNLSLTFDLDFLDK